VSTGPWFVAGRDGWSDSEIVLGKEESHHALKVLRIAPSVAITVTDGAGTVAYCTVIRVEDDRVVAEILGQETSTRPRPEVVVYQGAAKGNKADAVVERLAELGVSETWVYRSSRSVVRWDARKLERLADRWRAIAQSAAKQSRSAFVMSTGTPLSWSELVQRMASEPTPVVLWEEATRRFRTVLEEAAGRVALVVGPEGGLDRTEAEMLEGTGAALTSLGPRILRTENAPVVAATAVLYHYGLMG
jgi:16S rRNA (uracil1498-N3)-methyltransferase